MRVLFLDHAGSPHEKAGVLRLVAAARSSPAIEAAAPDDRRADVGVFLNGYEATNDWVGQGRPCLVFDRSHDGVGHEPGARTVFLKELAPVGVFADVIEAPSRTLRRVAFVTDRERAGLSATIVAAVRDRFELGLFATTSASGQALETISGCAVRVMSGGAQDDALRPFDLVASFSRDLVLRAAAMLKAAAWLTGGDQATAAAVPPFVYRIRPIELPALLAFHEPDRLLPDLFNWKRSAEADAVAAVGAALTALDL